MWVLLPAWAWLCVPAAAAVAAPSLQLESLTGIVQFRTADGFTAVARGAPLPIALPAGSQVDVLRGEAVFSAPRVRVSARAGQSFDYRTVVVNGEPRGWELAATGPRTSMLVDIDDSSLVVYEGDALSVVQTEDGRLEVQARAGYLSLEEPGAARILSPGESALLAAAPRAEPEPPIVAPGEELRSAVGPKPPRAMRGGCRYR